MGLAAIVETADSLRRDDPRGNIIPPILTGYNDTTGTLEWTNIPPQLELTKIKSKLYEKYSSISLLVNDIERFVGDKAKRINLKELLTSSDDLTEEIKRALVDGMKDENGDILIYLRIGRKIPNTHHYSDFSNAAILKWPSGQLKLPLPGIT